MRIVTKLINELKAEYNGIIDFKRICKDRGIGFTSIDLASGVKGQTTFIEDHAVIAMNKALPKKERQDWAWHELFHALRKSNSSSAKEEARATLFAALIIAPSLEGGDTIESVAERYNTSYRIAKVRIDHEIKLMAS